MSDYILVSAWTPNYHDLGELLIEDCARLDLPLSHCVYQSRGSWLKNCAAKPEFLLAAMDEHPGKAVVWVDADARIRSVPVLFDDLAERRVDFARHMFRWTSGHNWELLSGTLFFGATEPARDLLRAWLLACVDVPLEADRPRDWWDQNLLMGCADALRATLEVADLPGAYCSIAGDWAEEIQLAEGEAPVIVHNQASRTRK